jgi:hypothetical protein
MLISCVRQTLNNKLQDIHTQRDGIVQNKKKLTYLRTYVLTSLPHEAKSFLRSQMVFS